MPVKSTTVRKLVRSRVYNRRLILDELREHKALSKAELARLTGLTPPTIANIVDELKAVEYVRETGRRASPRGQPPVVIEINSDGGYSIGIRIDRRRYDVVISDLLGNVKHRTDGLTPVLSTEELVDFVAGLGAGAIAASKLPKKKFIGVGVVTPGPFDTLRPMKASPGSLEGFQTRSITKILGEKLQLPVLLENDAAAAAFGELLFGSGQDMSNFFYIFIAEGVGAGLVWNGDLYRGSGGNAGEFGHLIVDPHGKQCYCGNAGCLGQYLSLSSLRLHLETNDVELEKFSDVAELLENKNAHLMSWLDDAVAALRSSITTIENLLEPEAIMLGGTAPLVLLTALQERLQDLKPSINTGKLGERVIIGKNIRGNIAQGAAALPIIAATSANATVNTDANSFNL